MVMYFSVIRVCMYLYTSCRVCVMPAGFCIGAGALPIRVCAVVCIALAAEIAAFRAVSVAVMHLFGIQYMYVRALSVRSVSRCVSVCITVVGVDFVIKVGCVSRCSVCLDVVKIATVSNFFSSTSLMACATAADSAKISAVRVLEADDIGT